MADIEVSAIQIKKLSRIPTGIASFDTIIRGGIPSGSLVLLIGEAGTGKTEFVYTSTAMLSLMKNEPEKYKSVREQLEGLLLKEESLKLPESICFISFMRSKEDIVKELQHAFPPEFAKTLSFSMVFKDMSSMPLVYSKNWSMKTLGSDAEKEIFKEFISILDAQAPKSLVIISSLNNLMNACKKFMEWNDVLSFLKDLQQQAKKWDGIVYLLLTRGILESMKEEEIMDIVDGVIVFEWAQEGFSRQQTMHIKKFRGLMPLISKDNMVRLDTVVTNTDGFVVTNVKRISGRK